MSQIADDAADSLAGANTAEDASREMGDMAGELRTLVAQFRVDGYGSVGHNTETSGTGRRAA